MYILYIPWLLWVMLQWTWEYSYFFKIVVLFPLDVYPELELLDYGRAIFNFSRNLPTVFSSDYTSLHPYQGCRSVPFSPHPHQHFLSLVFLIMDILLITLYLLCFPYVQWCGALFHVPISHFYVFFGKMSIQILSLQEVFMFPLENCFLICWMLSCGTLECCAMLAIKVRRFEVPALRWQPQN